METHLKYIRRAEEVENEVASIIRTKHSSELIVVDTSIELVLRGIDEFSTRALSSFSHLERVRLLLLIKSSTSLRVARQSFERGYYQQTLTLIRTVMEDQLAANDVEIHPGTLAVLVKDGEGTKERLNFGNMAERTSPEAKEVWDDDYGTISKHAAHVRPESIQALITVDAQGRNIVSVHSHYDRFWADLSIYYLSRQLVQIMATTSILTEAIGSTWTDEAMPTFKEVDMLWKRVWERLED